MLYAVDDNESLGFFDLVDNAVNAAARRAHAGQFALKCTTESIRVVEQCAEHEFDDCCCGAFRKPVELSYGGTSDAQCVGRFFRGHLVG